MSFGFFCWKAKTISHNFHEQRAQILMLAMMFWPANNINNQQPTMSKTSHQINGWPPTIFLVNQSIVLILAYKMRHLPCI
jgi:hypothetical protein